MPSSRATPHSDANYRKVLAWVDLSAAYADRGEHRKARELLGRALNSAVRIRDRLDKFLALSATAMAHIHYGDHEQALRLARKVQSSYSDGVNLSLVAGAFAEAGRFEKGLKVAEMIRDPQERAIALAEVASGFAKRGHIERALWMARTIKQPGGKFNAFQHLASIRLESGQYLEALQAVKEIPLRHIQAEMLVTIAMKYAEAGEYPGPTEKQILREIALELG
jgi:tetratricopeptide (TPR) repeat protein